MKYKVNSLLTFNGMDDPEMEYLENRYEHHFDCDYEKDTLKYDLHTLDLAKKDYELVLLHQTLEHVIHLFA